MLRIALLFNPLMGMVFPIHIIFLNLLLCSALVSRALIENPNLIKWSLVLKALSGLFALICGNGYIVGINQIYDIGIDKYAVQVDTRHSIACYFTQPRV